MCKSTAYITAIKNKLKANQSYISVLNLRAMQVMQVIYAGYMFRMCNIFLSNYQFKVIC